jgi:hypothetical protein
VIAMHGKAITLAFVAAISGLACAAPPPEKASAEPPATPKGIEKTTSAPLKPLAQKKFGAEITEKTSTRLDALLRQPGTYNTKTVRTEGVVSAVCKSMGCWMELKDEAGQAHIKMAGHSFFVPKDAAGHRAVVQGKVIAATPANDECAEEAKAQTGQVAKVEIEAIGVEFLD